jgi:hypothetical protein
MMQRYSAINRILIDADFDSLAELSQEIKDKTGVSEVILFSGDTPAFRPDDVVISNTILCKDCLTISNTDDVDSDFRFSDVQELFDILRLINTMDYRLLRYLTGIVIERMYKGSRVEDLAGFVEFLRIYFLNGLSVRCIPLEIFKHRCFAKRVCYEKSPDILLVDAEILDADISKTRCSLRLLNPDGGMIYQGIETIRPSLVYRDSN